MPNFRNPYVPHILITEFRHLFNVHFVQWTVVQPPLGQNCSRDLEFPDSNTFLTSSKPLMVNVACIKTHGYTLNNRLKQTLDIFQALCQSRP